MLGGNAGEISEAALLSGGCLLPVEWEGLEPEGEVVVVVGFVG